MMDFHRIMIQFMDDLLLKLEQENKSIQSGEVVAAETIYKTLLRLIGVLKATQTEVNGETVTITPNDTQEPNLFDAIIKPQTKLAENQIKQIHDLLTAVRDRLNRYSATRYQIKLNRTKKLLEKPKNPIDSTKLIKNSPVETRKEISKQLKKIQESSDLTGILQQEIDLNKTLIQSIERVANLPKQTDEAGEQTIDYTFRSDMMSLMRAVGKESYSNIEKLQSYQQSLQEEATHLEDAENLLLKGQPTLGNQNQKLALQDVLEVLIILTDRQALKYNCSQCKHYAPSAQNSKNGFCEFSGGAISDQKLEVFPEGRPTTKDKSCKDTWNLENNDYYNASDDLIQQLEKLLKGK